MGTFGKYLEAEAEQIQRDRGGIYMTQQSYLSANDDAPVRTVQKNAALTLQNVK